MHQDIQEIGEIADTLTNLYHGQSIVHITYLDKYKRLVTGYRVYEGWAGDNQCSFRAQAGAESVPLEAILKIRVSPIIAPRAAIVPIDKPILVKIPLIV